MAADEDGNVYIVVVNHEEQYSVSLEYKPIPEGWRQVGQPGSKEECLEYIKVVWVDMRPLSLRRRMNSDPHAFDMASE
jgi:MbtH protein